MTEGTIPYDYSLEPTNSPTFYGTQFSSCPAEAASGVYAARARSSNGNSKRRSPDGLIPLDAPTQPRRYLTPSATSKKDVPSFFAKRRSKSLPSDGEEDELEEEADRAGGIPNSDFDEIEKRRRKNTLAARRSRMKKLEQRVALEQAVERLTAERDIWKTRALTLQSLLATHGIPCPDFD